MAQAPDTAIAERIDKLVNEKKISYSDLGRRLNVTPAAAWSWGKAKTSLSLSRIKEIADVLEVDPAYLAFGDAKSEPPVLPASEPRSLRWKFDPEAVEMMQYKYGDSPLPEPVNKWRLSRDFVEHALKIDERFAFLVECGQDSAGDIKKGDMLFVDRRQTFPAHDGEGFYLIFRPFFPVVAQISVKVVGEGDRFSIRYSTQDGAESSSRDVDPHSVTILGKVVGTMQRFNS